MARFAEIRLARDPLDEDAAALLAEARLRAGDYGRASREAASKSSSARPISVRSLVAARRVTWSTPGELQWL